MYSMVFKNGLLCGDTGKLIIAQNVDFSFFFSLKFSDTLRQMNVKCSIILKFSWPDAPSKIGPRSARHKERKTYLSWNELIITNSCQV